MNKGGALYAAKLANQHLVWQRLFDSKNPRFFENHHLLRIVPKRSNVNVRLPTISIHLSAACTGQLCNFLSCVLNIVEFHAKQ